MNKRGNYDHAVINEQIRDIMFTSFNNAPEGRLRLQDLLGFCRHLAISENVLQKELKELLGKYCFYKVRGLAKGTYELKPEFRAKKILETSSSSSSSS